MAFTELMVVFVGDFGVAATRTPAAGGSAQDGTVIFDQPGSVVDGMDVIATEPLALMASTQWPTLAAGDLLTIGAHGYRVRQVLPLDDGATKRAVLAQVS